MSFISIDYRSRTPIFEQIVASVEELVLRGVLKPDEQLPSVRSMATELGINPNTIQKAYATLESMGIIYSLTARGSFVSAEVGELKKKSVDQMLLRFEYEFSEAKKRGVTKEEIIKALDLAWRD